MAKTTVPHAHVKHRRLDGIWYPEERKLWLAVVGDVPESPNLLRYKHWRTTHAAKKRWFDRLAVCINASRLPGRPPCDHEGVHVTIRQYRRRCLDPDNLVASVKALLDGLQKWDVIRDDASPYLTLSVFQHTRPKKSEPVETHVIVEFR
jgi:hypothetical protein